MTGDKIHVLLVEDNPGDARLVKGMLERDASSVFTIQHVSTLEDGMRSLAPGSEKQVVLLDLGLPDETGLKTLRRIMPLAQNASVVVITGLQDEELGIAAIREGAHDYLIKGQVDAGHLRRILRYAVERHQMQTELRAEIEKRGRAQQALQLSEQRYRMLIETAPMGILIVDERGRMTEVNQQTERMFGYGRSELIGQPVETLLPQRFRQAHEGHRAGYAKAPRPRPIGLGMELIALRKDGTEFPVEISLGPLVMKEGVLIFSTIVDITGRRKLEEQLRQSQRLEAIGQLAGGIAHDFNNLLGVILGNSELILDSLPSNHPAVAKVEQVKKAATSGAELTRKLLAFSCKQVLQLKIIDLREAFNGIESLIRRLIGENIEVAVSFGPRLGCVKADPVQIEQVILNLVVNARDAMPDGGKLTVQFRNVELDESFRDTHRPVVPGPYVMLAVQDTGCGMDSETLSRVFEPFFTTKKVGKGTGLGLATVHGIVTQSGGHVFAYSELQKGTIFKLYFPRAEEAPQPVEQKPEEVLDLRGEETILLVEDAESLREMAQEYLQSLGYTVLVAENGLEALRRASEFTGPIHLLLTDVIMPEMSGHDLADRITQARPEIKVFYTSGYADDAITHHGVLQPGVAFIEKPYRPQALARKVREVLGSAASKKRSGACAHNAM